MTPHPLVLRVAPTAMLFNVFNVDKSTLTTLSLQFLCLAMQLFALDYNGRTHDAEGVAHVLNPESPNNSLHKVCFHNRPGVKSKSIAQLLIDQFDLQDHLLLSLHFFTLSFRAMHTS